MSACCMCEAQTFLQTPGLLPSHTTHWSSLHSTQRPAGVRTYRESHTLQVSPSVPLQSSQASGHRTHLPDGASPYSNVHCTCTRN